MSTKILATAFLVLRPTRRAISVNHQGVRPVIEFTVDRITKSRPTTKQGEIATKVNISIDPSLFDKIAPVIDVELSEGEIFANVKSQVAITTEGDQPE